MKKILFLVLMTLILGCNHSEIKKIEIVNINGEEKVKTTFGYVENAKESKKIAETVWLNLYGKHVLKRRPYIVEYIENEEVWFVKGTLPDGMVGGVPYIKIKKANGEILEFYHTK